MKNFFFILIVFLAFSCAQDSGSNAAPNGGYEISGKISNINGSMPVYLDRLSYYGGQPADTAIIANDGTFKMVGTVPHKGLYALRISQDKTWLIVVDNSKINIEGDFNDPSKFNISDTENKVLSEFLLKMNNLRNSLQQYQSEFSGAQFSGDQNKMMELQNKYNNAVVEFNKSAMSMADTTKFPLIGLFAVTMLNMEQNAPYLSQYAAKLSKTLPENSLAKEFIAKVNSEASTSVGSVAPDFTLKTSKGESISLKDTKGKVVLLDFWASWCRPCRMENPNVVRLYNQYKNKGFTVFSVSLDNNLEKWVAAIQQDGLVWPYHGSNLLGWQCPVAQQFKVQSIPQTFLLDKDGKIIGKNLRGIELENKLRELFGS
jgi:peroxiredoxin